MLIPGGCTASLAGQLPGAGNFVGVLGYLAILVGLVSCAVVYGLWTLQEWGRSLAYWLYLAFIPLGLLAIFPPFAGPTITAGNTVFQLVTITIDLFIIAYLAKSEIIRLYSLFGTQEPPSFSERRDPF